MTGPPRARRVLVCEDSKPYAVALTRFLEKDDQIEVVGVAPSGERAIADVGRLRPDLLTLDVQLPGMDGLTATALLKEDPLTAAIPIIALSALAMKADEEKSRSAGCDAYIVKPLRYQELYAAMNRLLADGRRAAAVGSAEHDHP